MKNKGFTLVELLITISIIGILSMIIAVSFSKIQKDGRDQRRIGDLKSIQNAAEQMILLSGNYPNSVNYYRVTSPSWVANGQTVLNKVPVDPKDSSNYLVSGVSTTTYCVCALMENTKNSNAENATCGFANKVNYFCVQNQQ
jgi:prepilin-type N-terminal cleavage/methylation domain-containing protein